LTKYFPVLGKDEEVISPIGFFGYLAHQRRMRGGIVDYFLCRKERQEEKKNRSK
jgi:hypothetical protein